MDDWQFYTMIAAVLLIFSELLLFSITPDLSERVVLGVLIALVSLSSCFQGMTWATRDE